MRNRTSKHQEKIYQAIQGVGVHMSAEEVYQKVKEVDSTIGIATVYRQLNKLVEQNRILRIRDKDQGYVYDGNSKPHYHFHCRICDTYSDVWMTLTDEMIKHVEEELDAEIESHRIIFEGVCKHCKKNKIKGEN